MLQVLWARKHSGFRRALLWALAGAALVLFPAGYSTSWAAGASQLDGNWWSDGTYRVDGRNPDQVARLWNDQRAPFSVQPFTELNGLTPETGAALDEKCRAEFGSPIAFWLGWVLRPPNPMPVAKLCFNGRPSDDKTVRANCALLWSRGRPMVMAWNRPAEFAFACKEPGQTSV